MCFLQQYQHPPCLTQAICLDSICSLDNASNEYVVLLFYNISLACPHLRQATVCAVSNVDGIRQQAWETEMELQTVWHLWFGGMSNGWIATLGISRGRRNIWGQRKTDGWRGESIWLDSTHSEICERAYEFSWLLLHRKICLTHMGDIVKWCKKQVCTWSLSLPCMQTPYFRERHNVPRISNGTQSQRYISTYI